MHRRQRIAPVFALLGCAVLLATPLALAVAEQPPEAETEVIIEDRPRADLSPAMLALRAGIQRALAVIENQPFNTRDNTPDELTHWCLVFGCDTKIAYGGRSGKKINAVGSLCWNLPGAGYRLLRVSDGRVMARVGYGRQAYPSQFLAVLAQSAVPIDYEIRVDDFRATVADLVDYEKRNCHRGADLSFTLIGLAHYLKDDDGWKNDLGEDWSVERLIEEELDRASTLSECELTHCLMGLSYAVDRRIKGQLPVDGEFLRAQQYVGELHGYALDHQNADGTWHPSFFALKGTSRDAMATLRSTGHILAWLVFSLPEDQLDDPRIVRSVSYVANLVNGQRSGWNVASMSPRSIDTVMHAAHALAVYNRRVFEPEEPNEPAAEEVEAVGYRSTPE